jgi:hypothetical protein
VFRKQDTKIHFVGIGGMGMCGIAEVLANMGYRVSGSDNNDTEITRHLASIGCTVKQGHRADNLGEADVVVVSSAIKGYNPEVEAARARQIPVIPRAEMLGELMRMKYGIAVAGAHGKTTTTTMIHTVLMAAGLDPTAVIGGRVNSLGLANARWGKSDYLVAEADESDGSFLTLTPTLAVVTNVDAEHLDHYGTFDNVKKAFTDFCNRVPFYGLSALCLDNPGVQAILPLLTKRFTTYGLTSQAVYRARNVRHDGMTTRFVAWRRADELGEVALPMPGAHNVENALGVLRDRRFPRDPVRHVREGARAVRGRGAAIHRARRGRRRDRRRRLRSSSGGGQGDAVRRARGVRRPPRDRRVPAAPLHAHARSVGRVPEGVPRRRQDRHLRRVRSRREADRRHLQRSACRARARRRSSRCAPRAAPRGSREVARRAGEERRSGDHARRGKHPAHV